MAAMFGVVEAGEDVRFPLEPGQAVGISREGVGQDLQRDMTAQLRVSGLPDLPHAALADEGLDLVAAEPNAGGEGHAAVLNPCGDAG